MKSKILEEKIKYQFDSYVEFSNLTMIEKAELDSDIFTNVNNSTQEESKIKYDPKYLADLVEELTCLFVKKINPSTFQKNVRALK